MLRLHGREYNRRSRQGARSHAGVALTPCGSSPWQSARTLLHEDITGLHRERLVSVGPDEYPRTKPPVNRSANDNGAQTPASTTTRCNNRCRWNGCSLTGRPQYQVVNQQGGDGVDWVAMGRHFVRRSPRIGSEALRS